MTMPQNPYRIKSHFQILCLNGFQNISKYSDSTDISKADFYILAPLTEFAELLKTIPHLYPTILCYWQVFLTGRMLSGMNGMQLQTRSLIGM